MQNTYFPVTEQDMERSKQDHKQNVDELKQQHMLQLEVLQHDQKLLINSQMTKARLGEYLKVIEKL